MFFQLGIPSIARFTFQASKILHRYWESSLDDSIRGIFAASSVQHLLIGGPRLERSPMDSGVSVVQPLPTRLRDQASDG